MNRLHLVTICLLFVSCSPRIIERVRVQRDTTYVTAYLRDSVVRRDSIYIKEQTKGDTIKITEYRDRWRERVRVQHDTIIRHQIDTIAVQSTIEKKVEQPIKGWKKMRLVAFFPLLILVLIGWRREIYKLFKRYI